MIISMRSIAATPSFSFRHRPTLSIRHPRRSGDPGRATKLGPWIPAFTGMTKERNARLTLKRHLIAALELQDLPRLVRRCDLKGEAFQHLADDADLIGVGFGKLAGAGPKRILETDAYIGAHGGADGGEGDLIATGAQDRPLIAVLEQPVGRSLHMHEILGMGPDAAQYAEDRLDEQRRLDQAAVEEMAQIVEMGDVIAFELEARAVARERRQDVFDIPEGIAEHQVAGVLQMLALP